MSKTIEPSLIKTDLGDLENQRGITLVPSSVTIATVRAVLLVAQGVEAPWRPSPTRDGVLQSIETMGQLQIDTINVVARSPYFVLWTRLGDYQPEWLDELLAEGAIFEAWSHEACFMPSEDFSFSRARIKQPHSWRKRFIEYLAKNRTQADQLVEFIRSNGEVRSADFKNERGGGSGWWDWKEEKRLLEALFTSGELMIARRDKFQRVYNLTERVVPEWDEQQTPTYDVMLRAHVLTSVKALGVATLPWAADYYRLKSAETNAQLQELANSGELATTSIEGINGTAYIHPDNLGLLQQIVNNEVASKRTTLLSPFDPVVWDRRRGEELFDFHYRIECYTPAEKRVYGYFTLPILHRGQLVGRLDAKAHRADGTFEVRALHLEHFVDPDDEVLAQALAATLLDCAAWHKTPKVVIRRSKPRSFAPLVRKKLQLLRSQRQ